MDVLTKTINDAIEAGGSVNVLRTFYLGRGRRLTAYRINDDNKVSYQIWETNKLYAEKHDDNGAHCTCYDYDVALGYWNDCTGEGISDFS